MDSVASIGPVHRRPALKKYGEILEDEIVLKIVFFFFGNQEKVTHRPDLSVNEPNLRAPTDMECFMSSAL